MSIDDKHYVFLLEKGWKGEMKFDRLLESLQGKVYILHDLLLQVHHTIFQIDTMLITADTIYTFEVKNLYRRLLF